MLNNRAFRKKAERSKNGLSLPQKKSGTLKVRVESSAKKSGTLIPEGSAKKNNTIHCHLNNDNFFQFCLCRR